MRLAEAIRKSLSWVRRGLEGQGFGDEGVPGLGTDDAVHPEGHLGGHGGLGGPHLGVGLGAEDAVHGRQRGG